MPDPLTDAIRLGVLPVFAVAAHTDHTSRRVPNALWVPVLVVGVLALLLDVAGPLVSGTPLPGPVLAAVALSLFVVVPLAFAGWFLGLLGGGDAKAIMALAIAFPAAPSYHVAGWDLPLSVPFAGPFAAVVVVNALIVGVAYLLHLAVRNALRGDLSAQALYARPVASTGIEDRFGIVLTPGEGSTMLDYVGAGGVDAAVLRQYREWRGLDAGQSWAAAKRRRESGGGRWGAQRFVAQAQGPLYGATPADIRDALDYLDREQRVWFSPAVPYVVPLFVGLVLALTVGFLPTVIL